MSVYAVLNIVHNGRKEQALMGFFSISKGRHAKKKSEYKHTLLALIGVVIVLAVLLLNVFSQILMVVHYYGDSMAPALQDRQILIIHQTDKLERGDIAAFYYNNKVLVRRVIAEGGTTLELDTNGHLLIDNSPVSEPYVEEPALGQCNISFPFTVPHQEFFVMGDNRPIAMDSRLKEIGTVPQNRMLGKVISKLG